MVIEALVTLDNETIRRKARDEKAQMTYENVEIMKTQKSLLTFLAEQETLKTEIRKKCIEYVDKNIGGGKTGLCRLK